MASFSVLLVQKKIILIVSSQSVVVLIGLIPVKYYVQNVQQNIQNNVHIKKIKTHPSVTNKNFPEKSPYSTSNWLSFLTFKTQWPLQVKSALIS
jgi:hypothetical protein